MALLTVVFLPRKIQILLYWHADIEIATPIYNCIRWVEYLALRRANRIIVTSPQYRESSRPLAAHRFRIAIVPNCVDPRVFSTFREAHCPQKTDNTAVFVGRHVPYKNLDAILDVARLVPWVTFRVAGDGPMTPHLRSRVVSEEISNVIFEGRVSMERKEALLAAASVFVFPSNSRAEAFGVALLEAQLFCCPCVTLDVPGSGMASVNIHGETGLVVRTVDEFAEAVTRICDNAEMRNQLGMNARAHALNHFTFTIISKQINAIVTTLLTRGRP